MADLTVNYLISTLDTLTYDIGPYYSEGSLTGTVRAIESNVASPLARISVVYITIQLLNSNDVVVKQNHISYEQNSIPAYQVRISTNDWTINTDSLPAGDYHIRIHKYVVPSIFVEGSDIAITVPLSTLKRIYPFSINKEDGDNALTWPAGLPDTLWGSINEYGKEVHFHYPTDMDLTTLRVRVYVSNYATLTGGTWDVNHWWIVGDFSVAQTFTIVAEDGSSQVYDVITHEDDAAYLFVYDNIYTRVVPETIEHGETLNWFCLMSNSGDLPSAVGLLLTVTFEDSDAIFSEEIASVSLPSIAIYEDHEETGSWVIPDTVPLGEGIDYYVSFHLNASLIERHLIVSNWDESAKGIVFNQLHSAFIRETTSKSKFFSSINKDFYSLSLAEDSNQFYRHHDDIADGSIMLYGQEFFPSITFIVNKFNVEKIFSDMIMHLSEIGVKKIEYWTEDQYAIHEWPDQPLLQDQARPWIDPEHREDKWYLPIHNEEIADFDYVTDEAVIGESELTVVNPISLNMRSTGIIYINGEEPDDYNLYPLNYTGINYNSNSFLLENALEYNYSSGRPVYSVNGDFANTREMRGTWMKVKVTFNSLRKFALKSITTEFNESKI